MDLKERIRRLREDILYLGRGDSFEKISDYLEERRLFDRKVMINDIDDDSIRKLLRGYGIRFVYYSTYAEVVIFSTGNDCYVYYPRKDELYFIERETINLLKKLM